MKRVKQPKILNSRGEVIVLNAQEKYHAEYMQRQVAERFGNALGYEVSLTTLSAVMKKVVEQKFFEVAPADYFSIRVGENPWSTNITTFRSFDIVDDFETGVINTGGNNSRMASADAGIDSLNIKVYPWAKSIGWSIFDLEYASKSGNWDLIAAKEKSRKRSWDLGIQRIAFLGAKGLNAVGGTCLGLLNQAGITVNTSIITKPIGTMTTAELKTLCATLIEAYRSTCARTAWPDKFIIPESDFNSLAAQSSPDFPIKSVLAVLEEALQLITRNKNFKILPLAYGDKAYSGYTYQQYVLLNSNEDVVRMDVPLMYTNTMANSLDGFSFQNAGYGQFTGVMTYRPLEMMYFQFT